MISVGVRLAAFNLKQIANLTCTDELDLYSIGEKKVALFCCIPDADTSLNYLVGMIYSMGRGPKRTLAAYAALVLTMTVGGIPVLAAGDPLSVINNLSTFIFSLIRAIGLILLGFGVVQVGLSLKSHAPSQRANGFLTLAGGVIITFAKEILDLIVG